MHLDSAINFGIQAYQPVNEKRKKKIPRKNIIEKNKIQEKKNKTKNIKRSKTQA